jgi:hypothetical protein
VGSSAMAAVSALSIHLANADSKGKWKVWFCVWACKLRRGEWIRTTDLLIPNQAIHYGICPATANTCLEAWTPIDRRLETFVSTDRLDHRSGSILPFSQTEELDLSL